MPFKAKYQRKGAHKYHNQDENDPGEVVGEITPNPLRRSTNLNESVERQAHESLHNQDEVEREMKSAADFISDFLHQFSLKSLKTDEKWQYSTVYQKHNRYESQKRKLVLQERSSFESELRPGRVSSVCKSKSAHNRIVYPLFEPRKERFLDSSHLLKVQN